MEKHIKNQPVAFKEIFIKQPTEMIFMMLLASVRGSIHYIIFSYVLLFMDTRIHIKNSMAVMSLFLLTSFFCYPLFGYLADKCPDRIKISKNYTLFLIFWIFVLSFSSNLLWFIPCFLAIVICYSAISSYITSLFAEIFHENYRMTACSLCYNLGTVFSGFSPFISELLTKELATGFYMFLLLLGFFLYILQDKIKDTNGYKVCIKIKT